MTAVPVTGTDVDSAEVALTLADLDAGVGGSPEVPEEEIAVRYYSDEALSTAIRRRRIDGVGDSPPVRPRIFAG